MPPRPEFQPVLDFPFFTLRWTPSAGDVNLHPKGSRCSSEPVLRTGTSIVAEADPEQSLPVP